MGAEPYWYFVPYNPDITEVLEELREREFRAGRYGAALFSLEFPIRPDSPAPGPEHASIEEAIAEAGEVGTGSILDIQGVADEPDFLMAGPLDDDTLEDLYGTTQPTREMLEANMAFLEDVDRGMCVYIIVYREGKPDEILFAGYSFD